VQQTDLNRRQTSDSNYSSRFTRILLLLHSPEFYDKKLFAGLINALKDQGLVQVNVTEQLIVSAELNRLDTTVNKLLPAAVAASIMLIGN
jgi:glycerol-3-phosphate O-acyltransferase